jgi:hypothetical protein
VKGRADLGDALSEITKGRADALFVSQALAFTARRQFLDFAAKNRLPIGRIAVGMTRQGFDLQLTRCWRAMFYGAM